MNIEVKQFAVIGKPIGHSLSPIIHNDFAKQFQLKINYEKIEVEKESFHQVILDFWHRGGMGLNITLPYKEQAFALADICTLRAQKAKAVNTLWFKDGKLHADNTDGHGLLKDLSTQLNLQGLSVLVLGAGGACRGIIEPLLQAKIKELTVANRSEDKLTLLSQDFPQLKCLPLQELRGSFDLIINATAASLTNESIVLPQAILKQNTFCYDLAYNLKQDTPFVSLAKKLNLKAQDGLGMLIEQAAEAFYIWLGLRPETEHLKVSRLG